MENINKYLPLMSYMARPVFTLLIHTINKLIWLAEQKPELVERVLLFCSCHQFLLFSTGEMVNDITMAGTSC